MKYITRTVTTYNHVIGSMKFNNGNPIVEVAAKVELPRKMGSRVFAKWKKENGINNPAVVILSIEDVNRFYRMELSKFMEQAEEVSEEQAEEVSEEQAEAIDDGDEDGANA